MVLKGKLNIHISIQALFKQIKIVKSELLSHLT